ncbi:MAG: 3-deoxy-manno-octulosonate cytidylyltransferase [Thermodesulfovibrionales bacterium]|nr:3-deoxy-manno-octulosonate cytidylyltransferase [Thermodesulfovibrionales bacterium]
MSAIVVIPARFDSVRFQGKPLALINGKTMIRHVFERAKKASNIEEVFVATDDERIAKEVLSFGGQVCITSRDHKSGTDRIAEAIVEIEKKGFLSSGNDIVINLQGDEPLIYPPLLEQIVDTMENTSIDMVTFAKLIDNAEDIENANIVKVVFDLNSYALYFSRSPIPFQRKRYKVYKHIGLYGYRKEFLKVFTSLMASPLEIAEGLEQLRALENGFKIKVLTTDRDTIGVDTPEDIERVEKWIKNSSL